MILKWVGLLTVCKSEIIFGGRNEIQKKAKTHEKILPMKKKPKNKEELSVLKNEVEALNKNLAKLSEEELKQIAGGYTVKEEDILNEIKLPDFNLN